MEQKPKKKKRNIILGVIVGIIVIAAIGGMMDDEEAEGTTPETTTAAVTTLASEGTAEQTAATTTAEPETVTTTTTEAPTTTEEAAAVYRVGEELDISGFKITLTEVTKPEGSSFITPADGKEYVVLHFEIDNQSGTERNIAALVHFDLYVDQYATDISITATTAADESLIGGTVADGRKMTGVVGLEVDKGWQEIEAVYQAPGILGGKHTFVVNP